ncbi:MAG: transglutaminase domain-containing protein [Motilibacteraceae bacterium]
MQLVTLAPAAYLGEDDVVDRSDPRLVALAADLRAAADDDVDYARRAFELARDEVRHSWDAQDRRVTLTASEVLGEKVGLCYGKSHLLVALLRAPGIPAGFCYQRLAWPVRLQLGEVDYPDVLPAPAPEVVGALRAAEDMLVLCAGGPPSVLQGRLEPVR